MKSLRRGRVSSLLLVAIFGFGYSRSKPESSSPQEGTNAASSSESTLIRASDSPADEDSREPELNATPDGRIILSWVQRIDAKRYALRTSMRDINGWSEARTVAFHGWRVSASKCILPGRNSANLQECASLRRTSALTNETFPTEFDGKIKPVLEI